MALGSLPASTRKNARDESGLRSTIIKVVRDAASNAPRSLQKTVGPSQVGTPCDRQLAYKMNGTEPSGNDTWSDPWASIVGTATHAWLDNAFQMENDRLVAAGLAPRWHLERRVHVGFGLTGSCDCFDEQTGTVLDWKILGNTSYSKYTKDGPSEVYRTQAHTYGLGYIQAGYDVKRVGIGFFGRAKKLTDLHVWSEPFNMEIALRALARMKTTRERLEAGAVPQDFGKNVGEACTFCEFKCGTDGTDDGYCDNGQG